MTAPRLLALSRSASSSISPMAIAGVSVGCGVADGGSTFGRVASGTANAIDLTAVSCFGGFVPFLAVYAFGTVVVAAIIGMMFGRALRWRRLAKSADAAVDPDAPLRVGPAILSGVVAPEEEGAAVRVEVHQRGSEEKDGSGDWTHRWDEKARRIRVRPFVMRLRSGERVRVEPTREVQFMDALDGVVWINRAERVLVAELTPGESLIAVGHLERRPRQEGYRGSVDQWALVEPKAGMMLSTEPLGLRFRARAIGAAIAVMMVLLGWMTLHALTSGYHLRVLRGETVVGRYVSTRTWTTRDGEGDLSHHRQLTVRLPDGSTFDEEITTMGPVGDAYVRLVPGKREATSFGRTPTLHSVLIVAHLAFPFLAWFLFAALTPARWYESASLRSEGIGRLEDPPEHR